MNVITLTPSLLHAATDCLSAQIARKGICPSYIVAIKKGGAEVGKLLREHFPEAQYQEVSLTRYFGVEKSFAKKVIMALPVKMRDWLRMMESVCMSFFSRWKKPERYGTVELSLAPKKGQTILIVDDAIDTGATISIVKERILAIQPEANIQVAVITVTTQKPLCDADFCLYHNQTLCRFPWSMDYE